MLIYAISGQGEIQWMPIISTILPLILGMILGNLDKDFWCRNQCTASNTWLEYWSRNELD